MNESNIFSPTRFFCFWRKEARENRKSTLLQMGVLYGMLTLIMLGHSLFTYIAMENYSDDSSSWYAEKLRNGIDPTWDWLFTLFIIGLFTACAIYASNAMNQMQSKAGRVSVLMTPVSAFEQYLAVWLRTLVGFLLAYLLCFALADFTRVLFFKILGSGSLFRPLYQIKFARIEYATISVVDWKTFIFIMLCLSALHAVALLGAMVWRRFALLKTCTVLFVLGWIYIGIIRVTSYVLPTPKSSSYIYYPHIEFFGHCSENLLTAFLAVIVCFGWVVAYLRFREAEVIHRM